MSAPPGKELLMTDPSSIAPADPESNAHPGILVVDDDAMLLTLLRTVLSRRGFQVWTASEGHAAVDLFREHQAQVSLVLLDVCMPGLDGPRTLAELRRVEPSLRACFMSGDTGDDSVDDLLGQGSLRFFGKPFAIHELADDLWRLAHEDQRRSA
jgi:DNA-binding response OmpR family regulator